MNFLSVNAKPLNKIVPVLNKIIPAKFNKINKRRQFSPGSEIDFPLSIGLFVALVMLILQPFRHFTYVTAHSPTLPLLHLRHSSFSNHPFASPTSRVLHLRHLASRPWQLCISPKIMHLFQEQGYSRGLKCLHVIYKSFYCNLTGRFFYSLFQKIDMIF